MAIVTTVALTSCGPLRSQDLSPRSYLITPLHSNAVTVTYGFYDGGLHLNGTVPVTGSTGVYNTPVLSLYHSLNFFGRSANVVASLPYAIGNFEGEAFCDHQAIYRSGLTDTSMRFTVNLKGGPTRSAAQFGAWRPRTMVGISVKVITPTGQYDGTKLVNWGTNRWSVKPELGYSRRWNKLVAETQAGVWFFTVNPASYNGAVPARQTRAPMAAIEGHLSYDLQPRLWVSLDGNFWRGGIASIDGIPNPATLESGSRLGVTALFLSRSVNR
jgi:hypothetical protein